MKALRRFAPAVAHFNPGNSKQGFAGDLPNLYVEDEGHIKAENKLLWGLQIVIGLYFIGVSGINFAGTPSMVEQFDKIGIGQWFRYVTASSQLLGGIALLTPKYSGYGAVLLACVMLGAIIVRVAIIGGNPAVAILLLLVTVFIAWCKIRKERK